MVDKGNVSTIAAWTGVLVMILEIVLKHFGIEIPQETITLFVTGLITFILTVWSSKNPNTFEFLGNATSTQEDVVGEDDDI